MYPEFPSMVDDPSFLAVASFMNVRRLPCALFASFFALDFSSLDYHKRSSEVRLTGIPFSGAGSSLCLEGVADPNPNLITLY